MNKPKTILATLVAARKLLSEPERWTKGVFARDEYHYPVDEHGDRACIFCSYGAVNRAAGLGEAGWGLAENTMDVLNEVSRGVYAKHTVTINDRASTTHAMVLDLFDQAIEVARLVKV